MSRLSSLRRVLFGDALGTALSLAMVLAGLLVLPALLRWAIIDASFVADAAVCQSRQGACWGVVAEKARFVLLGRYPGEAAWRAALAGVLIGGSWLTAALGRPSGIRLLLLVIVPPWVAIGVMAGGFGPLDAVPAELWGGLPLSLLLTGAGMAGALPLGIAMAYGRQSRPALIRSLLTAWVDIIRGIPLIVALFAASFMLPLFFPEGVHLDILWRVLIAIILFAAAYLSEIIRGGLQAFSRGQQDAAAALGLDSWQIQRHIVLPQVLRAVTPSIANNAVALFKDTSLVTVVSLYELTGSLGLALSGDPQWRPYYLEAYLFVALIYALGCALIAGIALRFAVRAR